MTAPLRGSSATTAPSCPPSAEFATCCAPGSSVVNTSSPCLRLALQLVEDRLQVRARLAAQRRVAEALQPGAPEVDVVVADRMRELVARRIRARVDRFPTAARRERTLRASTVPSAARIAPRSIRCCSSSERAFSGLSRSERGFEDRPARGEREQQREQQRSRARTGARSAGSSRGRALIRAGPSSRLRISEAAFASERSEWSSSLLPALRRERRRAHAGDVVAAVQREVARQPVGHAAVQRHQPAVVGADEVHRLQREVGAGADQRRAPPARPPPRPRGAGRGAGARRPAAARRGARAARDTGAGGSAPARRAAGAQRPQRRRRPAAVPTPAAAPRRSPAGSRRCSFLGQRRRARVELLEAQQHDRDVVAPARLVGRRDQRLAGLAQARVREQQLGERDPPRSIVVEPVAAQQVDVAGARREGARVDLDRSLRARARA